jgi:peroxiredoxin
MDTPMNLGSAGLLLLLLTFALASCGEAPRQYRPLQAGDDAPAYAAAMLDGDTVDLASLRGSPVMLNIWATWCAPCREEMPGLQTLHERFADRGLRVIGVSVDNSGAERAIRDFAAGLGLTFTLLHDPADQVARRFRTVGVPETFLIDADGRIVHRWIGRFDPGADDVVARVTAALPARDDG